MSLQALLEKNNDLVGELIKRDDEVDELNRTIDADAVRYITLRSPVARDVRFLTMAMKFSREIERIADEAVSIGRRARTVNKCGGAEEVYTIPKTAELSIELLNDAITTFNDENSELANELPSRDKAIDKSHRKTYDALTEFILKHKKSSDIAIQLMFISKSFERVGDHAANLAEEVYYWLESVDIRNSEKLAME